MKILNSEVFELNNDCIVIVEVTEEKGQLMYNAWAQDGVNGGMRNYIYGQPCYQKGKYTSFEDFCDLLFCNDDYICCAMEELEHISDILEEEWTENIEDKHREFLEGVN